VQHGNFGLKIMLTLWIPLLQSFGSPLLMPFYLLTLGSLYVTLIAIRTPFATIGSTFGKTTIFYLVTSTNSTPLDILYPVLWLFVQHNESKV
jgi:hypothetical protein